MFSVYAMTYSIVLVPYGSLASVMTTDYNERSKLSISRTIGSTLGNLPVVLFPVFVMTAGKNHNQLDGNKLLIAMLLLTISAIIIYVISFKLTPENIISQDINQKINISKTIKRLVNDKAFVSMSLLGGLVIAVQIYTNTVNVYLFKDYFGNSAVNTVYVIITYIPMVLIMPFTNLIIKKFGKKEFCVFSLSISTISSLITVILPLFGSVNVAVFIIFGFITNSGIAFIITQIWSMSADIIDHQEWVTGRREEAADFAIFTFVRKMGQALAALAPLFLSFVGYSRSEKGLNHPLKQSILSGMYNISTFVPFIMYLLMLICAIVYPLNKSNTSKMHSQLKISRSDLQIEQIL